MAKFLMLLLMARSALSEGELIDCNEGMEYTKDGEDVSVEIGSKNCAGGEWCAAGKGDFVFKGNNC